MNIIRKSSPAEMVLEWLKAELVSSRFSSDLKQAIQEGNADENIITQADITNDDENEKRLSILKKYRDWFDDDVDSYSWSLVELASEDIGKLEYIDYSYWNVLSDQTHKVEIGAKNIRNDRIVFNVPNDRFWSVANTMETDEEFSPIIIMKDNPNSTTRIVEGHLRATSYLLAEEPRNPLRAILGIARS